MEAHLSEKVVTFSLHPGNGNGMRVARAREPSFRREANFAVLSNNLADCFLIVFTYLMAAVGCRRLQMSLSFAEMSYI